jgi:hypothetical protein
MPVLAAFLAVGCIGRDEVPDEPSATPEVTATAASATAEPTAEPIPTAQPTATPTPSDVATPTPTASAAGEPSPSGEAGSVGGCSGTDDNRKFFADAAAAFDWPVYCAVLPARWFVEAGTFRSAGGGWLQIAYKGPGGARFELHEGAFCDEGDGCAPDGPDSGSAAFGDLAGTLVIGRDGRHGVIVDRGAARSWLAIGTGLDAEVFKDFAADLVRIED